MTKKNWTTLSASVTIQQKEEIQEKAKACGMNQNEYIIARLFHDQDDSNNSKLVSDIDKRNYLNICKTYALVRKIAEDQFGGNKEVLSDIENSAIDNAVRRGLVPNDFKPKIK